MRSALPLVKERRVDALGLADFRDGFSLQQVQTQDAHLVLGAVVTACCLVDATGSFQVVPAA